MEAVKVPKGEKCDWHKPIERGYIAAHDHADKMMAKGQLQKQCTICLYWFWKNEFGKQPKVKNTSDNTIGFSGGI